MELADDIFELRRLELVRQLQRHKEGGGTEKAFAERIGVADTYLTRLKKGGEQKGGKRIDTELAERFDRALGLGGAMINPRKTNVRELFPPSGEAPPQSSGLVASVNPNTAPSIRGQIWSLPVIKGDMMKFVHVRNADLGELGVALEGFQSAEEIDPTTDKAVELVIQTAGMEIGDMLIMRPKTGPVALRFRPVIVEAPTGEFFMMEYDPDQMARAGLIFRAYTVDRIARRPAIFTVAP